MNLEPREPHVDTDHDAFLAGIVRATDLLARRKWLVLGIVGGVVVAALAVWMVLRTHRLGEERASALLWRANSFMEAERVDEAKPLLEKVRDEFGGTRAAADARFFLGMNAVNAGDVAAARTEFAAFLDEAEGESFMTCAAQAGLAVCDERERKWVDAARAWTKAALMDEDGNFNAPTYLVNAALCWEQAGKVEEAAPLLDRILEKYPKSPVKARVEVIQARLKAAAAK